MSSQIEANGQTLDSCPDLIIDNGSINETPCLPFVQRIAGLVEEVFHLTREKRVDLAIRMAFFLRNISSWIPQRPTKRQAILIPTAGLGGIVGPVLIDYLLNNTSQVFAEEAIVSQNSPAQQNQSGPTCQRFPLKSQVCFRATDGNIRCGFVDTGQNDRLIVNYYAGWGIGRGAIGCDEIPPGRLWAGEAPDIVDEVAEEAGALFDDIDAVITGNPQSNKTKPLSNQTDLSQEAAAQQELLTTHQVQSGETLSSISQKYYGSTDYWSAIAEANPSINPDRIEPGMTLKIPQVASQIPQESRSENPQQSFQGPAYQQEETSPQILPAQERIVETKSPEPPTIAFYLQTETVETNGKAFVQGDRVVFDVATGPNAEVQTRIGSLVVHQGQGTVEILLPEGTVVPVEILAEICNPVGCSQSSSTRTFVRDTMPPKLYQDGDFEIKGGYLFFPRLVPQDASGTLKLEVTVFHENGVQKTVNAISDGKETVVTPVIGFGTHRIVASAQDLLGQTVEGIDLGEITYQPMRLHVLDHQEKGNGEVEFTIAIDDPTKSVDHQSPVFKAEKEPEFPPEIAKWVVGQLRQLIYQEKRGCQTLETDKGETYQLKCRLDDAHGEITFWWAQMADVSGRPVPGSAGSAKIVLSEKGWQLKILDGVANLAFLTFIISTASALAVGGPGLWYYQTKYKPQLAERQRRKQAIDQAREALTVGDFKTAWQYIEGLPKDFWPREQNAIIRECYQVGLRQAQVVVAEGDHRRAKDILDRLPKDLGKDGEQVLIQALYDQCNQLARREHVGRAKRFAERKDWGGAMLEYEFAIGVEPEHPDVDQIVVLLQKAKIEFARQKCWDQAEKLITEADYGAAWRVLRRGGIPEEEIRIHIGKQALAKAKLFVDQGQYREARKILRQLPTNFDTKERVTLSKQCDSLEITECLRKGRLAMVQKKWQEAVDYFTGALVLDQSLGEDENFKTQLDRATSQLKKEKAMAKAKTAASNMAFDVAIDLLEEAGFSREEIIDFLFTHAKELIKQDMTEQAFYLGKTEPLKDTPEGVMIVNRTHYPAMKIRLEREKEAVLAELDQEQEKITDPALRKLKAFLAQDHYDVLGISRDASAKKIKAAYKNCLVECHPDNTQAEVLKGDYKQAARDELRLNRCQRAYEILSVPERREHYNEKKGYI